MREGLSIYYCIHWQVGSLLVFNVEVAKLERRENNIPYSVLLVLQLLLVLRLSSWTHDAFSA